MPTILETTQEGFSETLGKIAPFAKQIQIDFDDGTFGGNRTVRLEEIIGEVKKYSEEIRFEAHLMVQRPLEYVVGLEKAGVQKVIIQAEKDGELRAVLEEYSYQGFLVGLGVMPESDVEILEPYLEMIDTVLILTVEPGHQGNAFLPDNLKKIAQVKALGFAGEIEVDGGIDDTNIQLLREKEADIAVVGHYLVKSENPQGNYYNLEKLSGE